MRSGSPRRRGAPCGTTPCYGSRWSGGASAKRSLNDRRLRPSGKPACASRWTARLTSGFWLMVGVLEKLYLPQGSIRSASASPFPLFCCSCLSVDKSPEGQAGPPLHTLACQPPPRPPTAHGPRPTQHASNATLHAPHHHHHHHHAGDVSALPEPPGPSSSPLLALTQMSKGLLQVGPRHACCALSHSRSWCAPTARAPPPCSLQLHNNNSLQLYNSRPPPPPSPRAAPTTVIVGWHRPLPASSRSPTRAAWCGV